jgi:hypothetical protein
MYVLYVNYGMWFVQIFGQFSMTANENYIIIYIILIQFHAATLFYQFQPEPTSRNQVLVHT